MFRGNFGRSPVKSETAWKAGSDPSRFIGGSLISKGTQLWGSPWVMQDERSLHPPSLKFIERPWLGSLTYMVQKVSTPYGPKAARYGSSRWDIPSKNGTKLIPGSSSLSHQWSHLLGDLPQQWRLFFVPRVTIYDYYYSFPKCHRLTSGSHSWRTCLCFGHVPIGPFLAFCSSTMFLVHLGLFSFSLWN